MSAKKRSKKGYDSEDDYDPDQDYEERDEGGGGEDFSGDEDFLPKLSRKKAGGGGGGGGRKAIKSHSSVSYSTSASGGGGSVGSGSSTIVGHIDTLMLDCSQSLTLKEDHMKKPCWIYHNNLVHPPENIIVLEAFSPIYQKAYDFLVSIADPVARPKYVHRYKLTTDSLYAAAALGQTKDDIINNLEFLCKTNVPHQVIAYIEKNTESFGKAKLVLKDSKYRIEAVGTAGEHVLSQLLDYHDEIKKSYPIRDARVIARPLVASSSTNNNNRIESNNSFAGFEVDFAPVEDKRNKINMAAVAAAMDDDDDDDDDGMGSERGAQFGGASRDGTLKTYSFMIRDDMVHEVKQCANKMFPLLEEYDYNRDTRNPTLNIEMKAATRTAIRPYQQKALMKMFGNGRARSGLIVLPCGAGKTLTGIAALATIKKSAVILCINNVSVQQWKDQIKRWTSIEEKSIKMFANFGKELLPDNEACIVLTTYSMLSHTARSAASQAIVDQMIKREWGLLLLDEVHVAPAEKFQKVVSLVKAHTKLGLTATLVREDDKIQNLQYLVGPKLYEANWINLTDQGYLARVECNEVWCPMLPDFFREYISTTDARYQRLLYGLNPRKLRTCAYLVDRHRRRQDKVLIFSDDIPVLRLYCKQLACEYIDGSTPMKERQRLLDEFRTKRENNVLGLSRVGDIALDLPEANIIIQVSSQFGSNRQEAQRLGRVLRPKPGSSIDGSGGTAIFYSLVSKNTKDMYFASKRQKYLLDQGYTFHINKQISEDAELSPNVTVCREKLHEGNLLSYCKNADKSLDKVDDDAIAKENENSDDDDGAGDESSAFSVNKRSLNSFS